MELVLVALIFTSLVYAKSSTTLHGIVVEGRKAPLLAAVASFGPEVPVVPYSKEEDRSGSFFVSELSLKEACKEIKDPKKKDDKLAPKFNFENSFIIVPRGGCSYAHKAVIASSLNASGLILVNNRDHTVFQPSISGSNLDLSKIQLPVMMVSRLDGAILSKASEKDGSISIIKYHQNAYGALTLLPFVVVGAASILVGSAWATAAERKLYYEQKVIENPPAWFYSGFDIPLLMVLLGGLFIATTGYIFVIERTAWILYTTSVLLGAYAVRTILLTVFQRQLSAFEVDAKAPFSPRNVKTQSVFAAMCIVLSCIILGFAPKSNGWIGQNILSFLAIVCITKHFAFESIRIPSLFLSLAFMYQLFWYYLQPFWEEHPVDMYETTKGFYIYTTLVLRFPAVNLPFLDSIEVDVWEILLPALFLTCLLKFDYRNAKFIGYFPIGLFGFLLGFVLNFQMSDPIEGLFSSFRLTVPLMSIPVLFAALYNDEVEALWEGRTKDEMFKSVDNRESSDSDLQEGDNFDTENGSIVLENQQTNLEKAAGMLGMGITDIVGALRSNTVSQTEMDDLSGQL